jgi:hypothetical protein
VNTANLKFDLFTLGETSCDQKPYALRSFVDTGVFFARRCTECRASQKLDFWWDDDLDLSCWWDLTFDRHLKCVNVEDIIVGRVADLNFADFIDFARLCDEIRRYKRLVNGEILFIDQVLSCDLEISSVSRRNLVCDAVDNNSYLRSIGYRNAGLAQSFDLDIVTGHHNTLRSNSA